MYSAWNDWDSRVNGCEKQPCRTTCILQDFPFLGEGAILQLPKACEQLHYPQESFSKETTLNLGFQEFLVICQPVFYSRIDASPILKRKLCYVSIIHIKLVYDEVLTIVPLRK